MLRRESPTKRADFSYQMGDALLPSGRRMPTKRAFGRSVSLMPVAYQTGRKRKLPALRAFRLGLPGLVHYQTGGCGGAATGSWRISPARLFECRSPWVMSPTKRAVWFTIPT